jgi:hypothetical protein
MVGGSLRVLQLLPPLKLVAHDILAAEILLKVALNTINKSINQSIPIYMSSKKTTISCLI